MAVIRVQKNANYTCMSNYHLRDKRLSNKAIGLMCKMLSLPDNWDYSILGLTHICKDGKDGIMAQLQELEKTGYLVRKAIKDHGKFKDIEYTLYEKPYSENPHTEKSYSENPTQLNTKELSKEENNNILSSKLDFASAKLIKDVIDYLNDKTGKSYRATTGKNKKLISARAKEGFSLADFQKVIDTKVSQWLNSDMEKYLRPETLFGTKFEGYLQEKSESKKEPPAKKIVYEDEIMEAEEWI